MEAWLRDLRSRIGFEYKKVCGQVCWSTLGLRCFARTTFLQIFRLDINFARIDVLLALGSSSLIDRSV